MKLHHKTAIVTGGSAGIGAGIVKAFLEEGANVVSADLKPAEQSETANNYLFVKTDMSDTNSVNAMIAEASARFGGIDILINNAGYSDGKSVETQSEAEWDAMFNTNVSGYARAVRAALPFLKKTRGNILCTASFVGINGQANAFSYCSTKGAVIGMVKNLAIDLAPYGIRVNAICPGWILTDLLKYKWTARQPNPDTALDELAKKHPLGRIGLPEDCAKAALYLCSDDASFVTGAAIVLDGGISLGYRI